MEAVMAEDKTTVSLDGQKLDSKATNKKRFATSSHFIDHITKDVLPSLLDKLSIRTNQSGEDS
jgi:hypothetical protein